MHLSKIILKSSFDKVFKHIIDLIRNSSLQIIKEHPFLYKNSISQFLPFGVVGYHEKEKKLALNKNRKKKKKRHFQKQKELEYDEFQSL